MTVQEIFDAILGQAGVLVLLLVILWSGWRGYWVFGRYYEDVVRRNERLERKMDRILGAAETGTDIAQGALAQAEKRIGGQSGV